MDEWALRRSSASNHSQDVTLHYTRHAITIHVTHAHAGHYTSSTTLDYTCTCKTLHKFHYSTQVPLHSCKRRYNRDTFYTPDQVVGYTDYPFLSDMDLSSTKVIDHRGVAVLDLAVGSEKLEQNNGPAVKFTN